jgi:hypothetical protein
MTYAQKMDATLLALNAYKNSLPPGDPEIAKTQEHIDWRNTRKSWDMADSKRMNDGKGTGLETPPPPPNP